MYSPSLFGLEWVTCLPMDQLLVKPGSLSLTSPDQPVLFPEARESAHFLRILFLPQQGPRKRGTAIVFLIGHVCNRLDSFPESPRPPDTQLSGLRASGRVTPLFPVCFSTSSRVLQPLQTSCLPGLAAYARARPCYLKPSPGPLCSSSEEFPQARLC